MMTKMLGEWIGCETAIREMVERERERERERVVKGEWTNHHLSLNYHIHVWHIIVLRYVFCSAYNIIVENICLSAVVSMGVEQQSTLHPQAIWSCFQYPNLASIITFRLSVCPSPPQTREECVHGSSCLAIVLPTTHHPPTACIT